MDDLVELHAPDSKSSARIAAGFGFNCFELKLHTDGQQIDAIEAAADFPSAESRPSGHGIPLLFPYPNRIRTGNYVWEGKTYHLPPERVSYNKTNAIHGFCFDRPWRVVEQTAESVTGEFQLSVDAPDRRELWPADFVILATYTLRDDGLRLDVEIVNPDDVPLPWGFGTHPYFKVPLSTQSRPTDCLIEVPVAREWELHESLPTGELKHLPDDLELNEGAYFGMFQLDAVFRLKEKQRESLIMNEAAGLQLKQTFSDEFREFVVFTPPNRDCVCLEPYTCTTDAINLPADASGLQVLPPGETARLWVDLAVSPVVA